jgi:hypothetical protein
MPPIVKVYEAIGAIADGRVEDSGKGGAQVASSDGARRYDVEIGRDGREVSSNDNASFWQGYLGYPAIAVLIGRGLYTPDERTFEALRGIPWREINQRLRNDWDKTVAEVERQAAARGFDIDKIRADAEAIMAALVKLAPYRGARRRPPTAKRTTVTPPGTNGDASS